MDRLTYISSYGKEISPQEISAIGRKSQVNNAKDNLTGVLLCFKGIFYQILEGDPAPLYRCFNRIQDDHRHSDLMILNIEKNVNERLYGQWKMKTMILDDSTDPITTPLRDLLNLMTRTYRTLERYVPLEVLEGIQQGIDPLSWGLERQKRVVLFVDMVGFSTMIEKINLAQLQDLLDVFFELASKAIDNTGGRISKLLGDGFMAYYSLKDASLALRGAISIVKGLKELRAVTASPFLKLAYCGIGISAGPLVMGNVGSTVKKDYTLLGDVVNSASRLETYTRKAGYNILFDHRFVKFLAKDHHWPLLKLGKYKLKGKMNELHVYTLDDPDVIFDRSPKQIAHEIMNIG